jgi:hypothetical protein
MSRQARTRSSLALGLILILVAGLWFAGRQLARAGETPLKGGDRIGDAGAAGGSAAKTVVFPLPTDFKVKLLRAGLAPRALAAGGVSVNSILPTLQAAADQMNGAPVALENADSMYVAARVAADALARKIQSGTASQEEIASYPAAKTALDSTESARQSVLDGYFSTATAILTANQRAALITIRANKAWGFPDEYLVVNKTEAQWLALREALSVEHQAIELPDMGSPAAQELLTTFRADPAVAFATTSVQTNLPQITNAWNTAAGD